MLEVAPLVQLLVLRRVHASCNMRRYYVLAITPTLFGDAALVREWGRIGKSTRRAIELHVNLETAELSIQTWLRQKAKRGYVVTHEA